MKNLFQKGITMGLGLAMMGKEQVEKVVDELVAKGEVPVSDSKNLVNEIMNKGYRVKKRYPAVGRADRESGEPGALRKNKG